MQVEDMDVQTGRARDGTRYQLRGSTGPLVVLVHGLGLVRSMWRAPVGGLRDDSAIARAAVAGLSLGGMIARGFAMEHSA